MGLLERTLHELSSFAAGQGMTASIGPFLVSTFQGARAGDRSRTVAAALASMTMHRPGRKAQGGSKEGARKDKGRTKEGPGIGDVMMQM
jgi:hypothetical protein